MSILTNTVELILLSWLRAEPRRRAAFCAGALITLMLLLHPAGAQASGTVTATATVPGSVTTTTSTTTTVPATAPTCANATFAAVSDTQATLPFHCSGFDATSVRTGVIATPTLGDIGTAITAGTTLSYRPHPTAAGNDPLTVRISDATGASAIVQGLVVIASGVPVSYAPPAISGTPVHGEYLTVAPGDWGSHEPLALAFQWQRCAPACTNIAAATSPRYSVSSSDIGVHLRVAVTATSSLGVLTVNSDQTAAVRGSLPVVTTAPTVTGDTTEGSTVSAMLGSWRTDQATISTHRWERCAADNRCAVIAGATGLTYRVTSADIGDQIVLLDQAQNATGTVNARSIPTAVIVAKAPVAVKAAAITGTAKVGRKVSGNAGTFSSSRPVSTTMSWERCDTAGNGCVKLAGTSVSRSLVAADAGHRLRIVITATAGGTSMTVRSALTAVVQLSATR